MRRLSTTALAGIITLAMAGCGSSEESNVVQPLPPTPQPSQQPEPKTEAKSSQEPTVVAQKPVETKPSSAAGLIQPTNPNQRTQQVQKGRSDPFAGLFTIAPPKVVVKPQVVPPPPQPPAAPPPPQPVAIQPAPRPLAPPPPPQPDLARGVAVLGVVEIGSQYQAIVQVPNEATSRYVSEGQRLSDGQVLVKSIEINPGSEPFVVLVQNGIEVTRSVGEEPTQSGNDRSAQSTTSSSITSSLPTTNLSSGAELNNVLLRQDRAPGAIPVAPPPTSKRSLADRPVPPPPAVEPSSEAELQSNLQLEQPPSVTSALPATLASSFVSGAVDSQLDVNYPPPAIRDSEMPQGSSKDESVQKRQNLQRYRQLVNRLKMGR